MIIARIFKLFYFTIKHLPGFYLVNLVHGKIYNPILKKSFLKFVEVFLENLNEFLTS